MDRLPIFFTGILLSACSTPAFGQVEGAGEGLVPIVIETEYGQMEAVLDSARAPITVTNFLRYVDAGLFDDARFFRSVTLANQPQDSVKIEVISGSTVPGELGEGVPSHPPGANQRHGNPAPGRHTLNGPARAGYRNLELFRHD